MRWETIPIPESSNIKKVLYNGEVAKMRITFKNNRTYEYDNVPRSIPDGMKASESAGKFAHAKVYPRYHGKDVSDVV